MALVDRTETSVQVTQDVLTCFGMYFSVLTGRLPLPDARFWAHLSDLSSIYLDLTSVVLCNWKCQSHFHYHYFFSLTIPQDVQIFPSSVSQTLGVHRLESLRSPAYIVFLYTFQPWSFLLGPILSLLRFCGTRSLFFSGRRGEKWSTFFAPGCMPWT